MNYPDQARRIIRLEIEELERLNTRIGDSFSNAIETLLSVIEKRGKIIVCGVGKSGNADFGSVPGPTGQLVGQF